jgi:hypothetical protein
MNPTVKALSAGFIYESLVKSHRPDAFVRDYCTIIELSVRTVSSFYGLHIYPLGKLFLNLFGLRLVRVGRFEFNSENFPTGVANSVGENFKWLLFKKQLHCGK